MTKNDTILTHVRYIRETQARHEELFNKLFNKLDETKKAISCQVDMCDKRFDNINKEIDTAKGFAKGAMIVGGGGLLGGIFSFVRRFL